jgi:hypothetical protein
VSCSFLWSGRRGGVSITHGDFSISAAFTRDHGVVQTVLGNVLQMFVGGKEGRSVNNTR